MVPAAGDLGFGLSDGSNASFSLLYLLGFVLQVDLLLYLLMTSQLDFSQLAPQIFKKSSGCAIASVFN